MYVKWLWTGSFATGRPPCTATFSRCCEKSAKIRDAQPLKSHSMFPKLTTSTSMTKTRQGRLYRLRTWNPRVTPRPIRTPGWTLTTSNESWPLSPITTPSLSHSFASTRLPMATSFQPAPSSWTSRRPSRSFPVTVPNRGIKRTRIWWGSAIAKMYVFLFLSSSRHDLLPFFCS